MATSSAISTLTVRVYQLLEHAYRRCKIAPSEIVGERIQVGIDLLNLRLSTIPNRNVALWAVTKEILAMEENKAAVLCPAGTVDVLDANLRTTSRVEASSVSASQGTAANAFDGDRDTACTQGSTGGNIAADLGEAVRATTFGLLPASSGAITVSLQSSENNISWTTIGSFSHTAVAGAWKWIDVDGSVARRYYRLLELGSVGLSVYEFFIGRNPVEVPLYKMNRDQYSTLPDKTAPGRPTQFWYDKQREQPILRLWNPPTSDYSEAAQIVAHVQRQVHDVTSMDQEVEVPQSWHMPIVARLAADIAVEDKEVDPNLVGVLEQLAVKEWRDALAGQTDGSPTFLTPRLGAYTRL